MYIHYPKFNAMRSVLMKDGYILHLDGIYYGICYVHRHSNYTQIESPVSYNLNLINRLVEMHLGIDMHYTRIVGGKLIQLKRRTKKK
jgi:hypothetical protein